MRSVTLVLAAGVLAACFTAWPVLANESTLYHFQTGLDGHNPQGALFADPAGTLYGTTSLGGSFQQCLGPGLGCGTIFQLTPPLRGLSVWTESVLYRFKSPSDGYNPMATLIMDGAGNLYGTTTDDYPDCQSSAYCGTVFELTPPTVAGSEWKETVLRRFVYGVDGGVPFGGVAFGSNGVLYGSTCVGGPNGAGTVFALAPPLSDGSQWTETTLHSFGYSDGYCPTGTLVIDRAGNLFGTTSQGGVTDSGLAFELSPPRAPGGQWTETILYAFHQYDGLWPFGSLVFDAHGNLFGGTEAGGSYSRGAIFELSPPTKHGGSWSENVIHSFTGSDDGGNPNGSLIVDRNSGVLYGTTANYGLGGHGFGVAFKLVPPQSGGSWTEVMLHTFRGSDGQTPAAGLAFGARGLLYGTTVDGGGTLCRTHGNISGCGVVFEASR